MSETNLNVLTGRNASRMRRSQLVSGKAGLPPAKERVRVGRHDGRKTTVSAEALPSETAPATSESKLNVAATTTVLTGRDASRARRDKLIQGKGAILKPQASVSTGSGQNQNGTKTRPCGRLRHASPVQYPPKVAESKSYAGHKVTGVRIGHKENVTGNEHGSALQVTGNQYIGTEFGYNPREGGIKVGASKTPAGQVITGSQVRSKINITGDESNPALRITGESDQELTDDLLQRREQESYSQMQFQRQNDPHGHTVFGTNLGRSIKSVGSRNRVTEYKKEETIGGHAITGTAVGRSQLTTGDESGSCHDITGDQYLMPAEKQPLCETGASQHHALKVGISHTLHGNRTTGTQTGQRIRGHGNITGTVNDGLCQDISGTESFGTEQYTTHCGKPSVAAGNRETIEAETWGNQRVTGVDVEHNSRVTGDEQGLCDVITGTPYVGPNQYQNACSTEDEEKMERRISSKSVNYISGDAVSNTDHVTGTQRGGDRDITGSLYYQADPKGSERMDVMERIKKINRSFSVHPPQREYHERAGTDVINAPTAESRITGTFSAGEGKITGNQEFHFNPRQNVEAIKGNSRVTGEGRVEGITITGSAWTTKDNVTGTEGHIAAERNPSQRTGKSHAWAGAGRFKGKGTHPEPTHHVTGEVGWSPKASVPITVSGGGRG